jgi:hypothetical protein
VGNRGRNLVSTPRRGDSSGTRPGESDPETIAGCVLASGHTNIVANRITLSSKRCEVKRAGLFDLRFTIYGAAVYCLLLAVHITMSENIIDGRGGGSFSGRAFCNTSSSNSAVISRLVSSGSKAGCSECFLT